MAYATVADMISWFGQADMVRLSTPQGAELSTVLDAPVTAAIERSTSLIDSYLRKRYAVPLGAGGQMVPPEITRCCCQLARYDLAGIDGKERGEQVRDDHKSTMAWLRDIAEGRVQLDITEAPSGDDSYARMSGRDEVFGGKYDDTYGGYNYGAGDYP